MAKHGRLVNLPNGSEMVNLDVFDHLEPFWAGVDPIGPFQTKNDFLFKSTFAKPYFFLMGQKIDFCLKWSTSVQMGPKLSKISRFTISDPFGPLWNTLECLFYWCVFLGHPVRKKSSFHFLYGGHGVLAYEDRSIWSAASWEHGSARGHSTFASKSQF